jgi:DUF1009 family protein
MTGVPDPVGIIAGGGSLPVEVARSITGKGGVAHVIMVEGEASDQLRVFPHTIVNWAELGHAIAAVKRASVTSIVMVGKMARPSFLTAKPDFGFAFAFPKIWRALKAGGDDAVLRGVMNLFEARGLKVVSVADVAPELLIGDGTIGVHRPSGFDDVDIERGFALISALGPYDIGQAVVVNAGDIESIEGAEGTDRMLARVAEYRRLSEEAGNGTIRGGVLVKRPKPGQDLRIDLPAIGPDTVDGVRTAALDGIAAMSGFVLAANRLELVQRADRSFAFITGVPDKAAPELATGGVGGVDPVVFGRYKLKKPAHMQDVTRGVHIMSTLSAFNTGSALVIVNGRVLSVGTFESPEAVLARAKDMRRRKRKRAGVLIIGPRESLSEAIVTAAADARLAGIIVTFGAADRPPHKGPVVAHADSLALFIAGAGIP